MAFVVGGIVVYAKVSGLEFKCVEEGKRRDEEIDKLRDRNHKLSNDVQKLMVQQGLK